MSKARKLKKRGPKPGHGGRPVEGRVKIEVRLLPEKIAALDCQRGDIPRGQFIERFV